MINHLSATKQFVQEVLIISIIFLFTFPKFEPDFGIGLDTSYAWGLNYLFANQYDTLIHLNYPVGPLGFLKFPTTEGNNLLFSILFFSVLKIIFIKLLLVLDKQTNQAQSIASILLIFMASLFVNIDFLVISITFIVNLLLLKKHHLGLFIFGVLVALTGLFIKTSIGVISLSIVSITPIIQFMEHRNKKILSAQIIAGLLVFMAYGLTIFKGNIPLFFNNLIGTIQLSKGYSNTLALHPNNNWILIISFLILFFSLPILITTSYFRKIYLLLMFPFFATWKHAMGRQDITHYFILIIFLIVVSFILVISQKKHRLTLLGVFGVSILLLSINMQNLPLYRINKVAFIRINNFLEVLDFEGFKKNYYSMSQAAIRPNKLPDDIREIIKEKTIDFYPWELSYAPANKLNWQPRKTIEIGASTSRWASAKATENIKNKNTAPDFMLLHLQSDENGSRLGSIDRRYMLNDEPLFIHNLLNHYSIKIKNTNFILFKKNDADNISSTTLNKWEKHHFGEWIQIPYSPDDITRVKVRSNNTALGKLKNFFYKEEKYLIDYLFEGGKILTFRYVPSTAIDGLWCNPFLLDPASNTIDPKVIKIRLRNTNNRFIKQDVQIQLEQTKLKNRTANQLFHKEQLPQRVTILRSHANFEQSPSNQKSNTTDAFTGMNAQTIPPKAYSYGFHIPLDSLWKNQPDSVDELLVEADVHYKNLYGLPPIIISTHDSSEDFWYTGKLQKTIDADRWGYGFASKTIHRQQHSSGRLAIYIWNTTDFSITIDDFRLNISANKRD